MGAAAWSVAEPAEDQRRYQRVKVRLAGRFMRSDRLKFDCVSIDASPGGIAFSSDAGVQLGERDRVVAGLAEVLQQPLLLGVSGRHRRIVALVSLWAP